MNTEKTRPPAAQSPSAAGSSTAASTPAAVAPAAAAAAEQGQGVIVLRRGIRGPFDGTIFFTGEKWIFVHSDGTPVILAPRLELLIKKMRELGYVEGEFCEEELYLETFRLDDPIISLKELKEIDDVLLSFEKGEIELEAIAKRVRG